MEYLVYLGFLYWGMWASIFVVGLFTSERTVGRACTGRPDVVGSILIATLWPFMALAALALILVTIYFFRKGARDARNSD